MLTPPLLLLTQVGVDIEGRSGIFNNISMSVLEGDRIAIMGPSGSGKSTLLAVAGGLTEPSYGQAQWPGLTTENDIAWVFQQTFILGYRSVVDNIALAGISSGVSIEEARPEAEWLCHKVGLGRQLSSKAGAISGGERQRIGVARAMMGNPKVIIADEPTASLDEELVMLISNLLINETSSSTAVIVATHDYRVSDLCPKILHLRSEDVEFA